MCTRGNSSVLNADFFPARLANSFGICILSLTTTPGAPSFSFAAVDEKGGTARTPTEWPLPARCPIQTTPKTTYFAHFRAKNTPFSTKFR
jgi:hypothetical protein